MSDHTQATFAVNLESFSGPMETLLRLVEERHLEISRVSLATITGDFIAHVERLGETATSGVLSEFVVVAARLLVLKSKELIPSLPLTEDEEADIMDLERRLVLYREFKKAGELLKERWDAHQPLLARPFLAGKSDYSFFYPSKQVSATILRESLEHLLHVVESLVPTQKTVGVQHVVSLQAKMQELTERLSQRMRVSLKGRVSKEQKHEVIVLFLAVLHLLANRLAHVEQDGDFGEITVMHPDEQPAEPTPSVGNT